MRKFFFFIFLCVLSCFLILSSNSLADETTLELKGTLNQMIKAVEDQDYALFVEAGDDGFKSGLSRQMFEGVSGLMSGRFKAGYALDYWGSLNQQGSSVYVWKVVFKDQGDDVLIRLVINNARVSGFWFQ